MTATDTEGNSIDDIHETPKVSVITQSSSGTI